MRNIFTISFLILAVCLSGCHTGNHNENEHPPETTPEQPQSPATLRALYAAIDATDLPNAKRITDELMTKSPGDFVLRFDKRENALFVAVKDNFIEFARWAVEKYPNAKLGADASFDPNSDNALLLALKNAQNNPELAALALAIVSHKTDGPLAVLNANKEGYRPIHLAVWLNNFGLVQAMDNSNKALKWAKAKVPSQTVDRTALELARHLKYSSIITILMPDIDDLIANGNNEERLDAYKNAKTEDKASVAEKLLKQGLKDGNEKLVDDLFKSGVDPVTTKIGTEGIEKQVKEKARNSDPIIKALNEELLNKMGKTQGTKDKPLKSAGILEYALFDYSLDRGSESKKALVLSLIAKLTVQPEDLIFAVGTIGNEEIILAMIDRIVPTSLSLVHKQDLMREIIDWSYLGKANSIEVVKKIVAKVPNILKIKFSPYETSLIEIHPFDYVIDRFTYEYEPQYSGRGDYVPNLVLYFKSLGDTIAPRIAESIPGAPNPKFRRILDAMLLSTSSEATILTEIKTIPNTEINHIEPGNATLLCNCIWDSMFTIARYLITVPGIDLSVYCSMQDRFKHIVGVAIGELGRCGASNKCIEHKNFILDLVVANNLDEISDINGKTHAILKLLIDEHRYKGAEVAHELITRRPTQKKDFGPDGMAKKYVKKLIKSVEAGPVHEQRGLQDLKDLLPIL